MQVDRFVTVVPTVVIHVTLQVSRYTQTVQTGEPVSPVTTAILGESGCGSGRRTFCHTNAK